MRVQGGACVERRGGERGSKGGGEKRTFCMF